MERLFLGGPRHGERRRGPVGPGYLAVGISWAIWQEVPPYAPALIIAGPASFAHLGAPRGRPRYFHRIDIEARSHGSSGRFSGTLEFVKHEYMRLPGGAYRHAGATVVHSEEFSL
jgi:hypothetical protein